MLWKCCAQYASTFGKLNSGHRTGKSQFPFQFQRKAMLKNVHYCTVPLISQASKVMLKILQARFQQYMNQRSNCQHPLDHQKGKRVPEKYLFLLYWLCQSLSTTNCGNSSREGNTRPPEVPSGDHLSPEKSVCSSRNNSLNWIWNNRLVPNRERSMSRLYIVTLLI